MQPKTAEGREPEIGYDARMREPVIRTVWKTASQQCEIVFSQVNGYRVRLWVQGRLIIDELTSDADSALRRGWELRLHWTTS